MWIGVDKVVVSFAYAMLCGTSSQSMMTPEHFARDNIAYRQTT